MHCENAIHLPFQSHITFLTFFFLGLSSDFSQTQSSILSKLTTGMWDLLNLVDAWMFAMCRHSMAMMHTTRPHTISFPLPTTSMQFLTTSWTHSVLHAHTISTCIVLPHMCLQVISTPHNACSHCILDLMNMLRTFCSIANRSFWPIGAFRASNFQLDLEILAVGHNWSWCAHVYHIMLGLITAPTTSICIYVGLTCLKPLLSLLAIVCCSKTKLAALQRNEVSFIHKIVGPITISKTSSPATCFHLHFHILGHSLPHPMLLNFTAYIFLAIFYLMWQILTQWT